MSPTLRSLLESKEASLETVAGLLDPLTDKERYEALQTLRRTHQRRLYLLAQESSPLELKDLVTESAPALQWVRHLGVNTLPVPSFLRLFEKRFFRPEGAPGQLCGYNEGASRPLIGPGYFVAYPTKGNAAWASRGDLVVDYFQVPQGPLPKEAPRLVPNTHGLQRFVYHGTRDFLRKVCNGVSIGAAYKGEKALDHYFTLCRVSSGAELPRDFR